MRRVLAIATGAKDYSAARKYGKLEYISLGSTNLLNVPRHIADIMNALYKTYTEDSKSPYIVVGGYGLLVGLMIVCALFFWKEVEALVWDSKTKSYNPVTISGKMLEEYMEALRGKTKYDNKM